MVVHDTPHKPTLPQQLHRRFDRCRLVTTMLNYSSDRTHAPFRSLTFLLSVVIESLNTSVRVCHTLFLRVYNQCSRFFTGRGVRLDTST